MSLVSKSGQLYSTFDPRSIGRCVLWLDAADSNTFTLSGANVTEWRDKSGNAFHASGGVSPTKSGNNVVFNGTTQYLSSSLSTFPDGVTGESVFVAVRLTSTTSRTYTVLGSALAGGRTAVVGRGGTTVINTFRYGSTVTTSISPGLTATPPTDIVGSGVFTGRAAVSVINGGALGPSTSLTITSGSPGTRIGAAGPTLSNYFAGNINEVIVYSGWLGSNDRQLVEGYLFAKWGLLTTPPYGHPYRQAVPFMRYIVPATLPGCLLWLDGADPNAFLLTGTNVTIWYDKSGVGRHASNGVSPTWTSNGVVFNGTTQHLQVPLTSGPGSTPGETIFVVATQTRSTNSGFTFLGSTLSNGRSFGGSVASGAQFILWRLPGGSSAGNTTGTSVGNRFLATGTYWSNTVGSNNLNTLINGGTAGLSTQATTATSTWTGSTTTNVGAHFITSLTNLFQGTIHEIVVFNATSNDAASTSNITTPQTRQIENYLATKWGLRGSTPTNPIHVARISPGLGGGGGVRFNPLSIPTNACTLWLDAADQSTITLAGSTVTGWADKSSNGPRSLTRVGSPQYVQSSLLNKLNCVSFTSSSSFFWSFNQAQGFTVFVVTAQLSVVADAYSFILEPSSSTAPVILFAPNPNPPGVLVIASGGTQLARNPPVEYYSGIAGVVTAVFSGSGSAIGWNGAFTTGTIGTGSWGGLYMGRDWSGTFVDQQVGEVLFYTGNMAVQRRQQVEGYLAWKWGFQAQLPSTHPYRNVKLY
jgi:hypothetical protein